MSVTYKQLIAVACLSVLLSACSSSGGASPDRGDTGTSDGSSDGTTGGATGGGTTGGGATSVGTTGGSTDINGAAAVEIMQGRWATGCLELAGNFRTQTLNIIGDRMRYDFAAFSDQECTIPVLIGSDLNGSTIQQNATTVPTGETRTTAQGEAVEVDFYFEEATVDNMPIPDNAFFGRDEFEARIDFDIVFVQNDILFFGDIDSDEFNGESAQTRPIALDTFNQYSRAP